MKTNKERLAKLRERLIGSRFADNADGILDVARGVLPLIHGSAVDVERASGRTAPNGESYHVRIKASTDGIARDSGVIPINAWERGGLRNFNENPIILAFHSHRDPIGKSVYTELDGDSLVEYWLFHEETDLSRTMKALYEKGFMRAASVGFLVHEWDFVDELTDEQLDALEKKYGKAKVKDIYWIARNAELLETSAVPVPSDPNALAFSFAARQADAVGMNMADLLSRWSPNINRENPMDKNKETPNPEARGAEGTSAPAAVTPPDAMAELRALIETGFAAIRGEMKTQMDALTSRLVVVETARGGEGTGAGTPAGEGEGEAGERGDQIEIEVRDGESEADALSRTLDEIIAVKRGAPAPKKK